MQTSTPEDEALASNVSTVGAIQSGEAVMFPEMQETAMPGVYDEDSFQRAFISTASTTMTAASEDAFAAVVEPAEALASRLQSPEQQLLQAEHQKLALQRILELPRDKVMQIACHTPGLAEKLGVVNFSHDELAVIARYQVSVAELLDFSRLSGTQTFWIAKMHPHLKDRCDLTKLSEIELSTLEYQK